MAIIYPDSSEEIANRIRTDVQNQLPESDPFLRESFIYALIIAEAGRLFDLYTQLKKLQNELFPDTATDEFADRWANFKGISRNPATRSEGNITVTGTATTVIPISTSFSSSAGNQYESTAAATISNQVFAVTSITRSGSTATVTTTSDHLYASSIDVIITGANEAEYNGTFNITVTDTDEFTYQVSGTPATPATGTIFSNSNIANVPIKSVEFGEDQNLLNGAAVTFVTPISGADQTAYVQFGAIGGGTDEESDDDFRTRYISAYQNPVAHFNEEDIILKAREVPGVTRVFVERITPAVGQVTIYFTRDNDLNIIPSPSEVDAVKEKIREIIPAHTEDADVIVDAPTPVSVDFTFTALAPNTSAMQQAISDNLGQMFREVPEVGVDLSEDAYRSTIWQSIDPQTGKFVESFTLSTPSGDISIASGEIAVLGNITF